MTSELVVDVQPKEVSIALLEDKSLVELQSEGEKHFFLRGQYVFGTYQEIDARSECMFRGRRLREKTLSFIILTWVLNLTHSKSL